MDFTHFFILIKRSLIYME